MARPGWMQASADRIFGLIEAGHLTVDVNQRYPLSDVVRAHNDLEGAVRPEVRSYSLSSGSYGLPAGSRAGENHH